MAPDKKLMAVSFDALPKPAGLPRVLFRTRIIAPNFYGFSTASPPMAVFS